MMISGGGGSSSGSGSTGQATSLSFVPALLSSAFFGSGIGIDDGGFSMTGLGDFGASGKIRGQGNSSLVDPFGLGQIVGSNPLLGRNNPFSQFNQGGGFGGSGQFGGGGGGSFGGGGGTFADFGNFGGQGGGGGGGGDGGGGGLGGLFGPTPGGTSGSPGLFGAMAGGDLNPLSGMFGGLDSMMSKIPGLGGLFGGKDAQSPEDQALERVSSLMKFSPSALGLGRGGALNPFDLVSNITDLANPNINPGIGAGLQGLLGGQVGGQIANALLTGGVAPTLAEGLETGFKPDLQPVINEASRSFFSEIVPQLGQSNVALQEGVGPFSTDLSSQLTGAGATLASQLGSLEVENQNRAADRRGEFLGLSNLITDQLFNASTNAGRNQLDLGEQLASLGTVGGRQATLLQMLAGINPSGPIQQSSSANRAKNAQGSLSI